MVLYCDNHLCTPVLYIVQILLFQEKETVFSPEIISSQVIIMQTRLGVDRVKPWNSVRIYLGLGKSGPDIRPGLDI